MHPETETDTEQILADDVMGFTHDPLSFILYIFPWGEKNTELENKTGPRTWQREILQYLGDRLSGGADPSEALSEAIQAATASGHGIGKSALVAWIIIWGLSTLIDTKIVVTANTEGQLRTKTWPEVAKWHRLSLNSHWFNFTATSLQSSNPQHNKTWRADAIPWSEHNTEAFAGLHNEGKRIILIFDEASNIPSLIWETAEGALTDLDTEIIWFAFGNPTKPTGRFFECFGSLSHRWRHRQIDSRTVDGTNKVQFQEWEEDHGADSDFFKVRVRGMFPSQAATQFISFAAVEAAKTREIPVDLDSPLICGIDFGRKGTDLTVMRFRRGRDARTYPVYKFHERNSMKLTAIIMDKLRQMRKHSDTEIDAIFGDGGGIGGPIIDRLNQLGAGCIEVGFGESAVNGKFWGNKRTEMWADMRDWLETGCIDQDKELHGDLVGPEYYDDKLDRILLEKKSDMLKRGLHSPDDGDALCLTFAHPVLSSKLEELLDEDEQIESEWSPYDA